MKKLFIIVIIAIAASALFTSCTEEELTNPKDNSGDARNNDGHW